MDVFDTFRRVFRQADSGSLSAAARQQLPLHTLSTQFRMAKPIAEVVSRVFYPVAGAEPEPDGLLPGRLASGREIGPLPLRAPAPLRGKSLVWLDTSEDPDCATDLPTWSNPGEADIVADLIGRIVPVPRPHRDGYSADPLAVLTPYRRQADLLRAAPHVKPHVYTVHAFQGREADIVVVSLVRSTLRGTEPTERPWESLGHLSRRELINVMISRARQLLVLVGDCSHWRGSARVKPNLGAGVPGGGALRVDRALGKPARMSGSAATVIYLPCDVVTVRARVSVGEGLSPIEKIVLRALDARPCTGPDLSGLLGLGDRMTVGVLHGLWRYGHLRIDHASRKMDVSDEIKRRIAAGGLGLDTLPGIDSEVVERELMIEKLTGHVLPSSGHPKAPPLPRLAVDHARADITLDGASRSAVADAFNHTIAIALRRLEARPEDAEGTRRTRRPRGLASG